MKKITWEFEINGSDHNPYEQFGVKQNPFPQHAEAELNRADLAIQSLGGIPVTGPEDIRKRLRGVFSEAFIESVVQRYKPGVIVHCKVTCQWEEESGRKEKVR